MGENAASRKMTSRFLNDGEQVRQGGRLLLLRTGRVRDCLQGRRRCGCAAASAAPPPAGKRAPAGGASAQGEAAGAAKCRLGHRKFKTLKEGNFRMGARHFGARESEVGCMFSVRVFEPHASSKPNASSKSESSFAPSSRSKTISDSNS